MGPKPRQWQRGVLPGQEERTEGWIAGLQLAAISLRGRLDPATLIEAFGGSQRFVLDYLADEVLGHIDHDLRSFLVQTSIAERFDAGLCRALTGREDADALLARAERANLFLVALDAERRWYPYHRRVLRTARPNAAERIALEIDQVAAEIGQAVAKREQLEQPRAPMSTSKRSTQKTMDEMTGLIENAALDTRVAWVRDLMDRVTLDGREEDAVAVWRAASDIGADRSDSVSSWLRRAGPGRVLNSMGAAETEIAIPLPGRSREWLKVALVECQRCHQVIQRTSPIQRYCPECRRTIRRARSGAAVRRSRAAPQGS